MSDAVIVAAVRTPVATAFKGTLTEVPPEDLARVIVRAAVDHAKIADADVDDVVLAESNYGGGDVARNAAIEAGLVGVPGLSVNRHCAGSLAAVQVASASILAGYDRVVVAGGVQSSSLNPRRRRRVPGSAAEWEDDWVSPAHPSSSSAPNRDMTITVGWNTAQRFGLTREDLDRWALRSHQRAVAAIDAGLFKDEIVPVEAPRLDGSTVHFDTDEHPRRGTTLAKLTALKPLHPEIDGFSITAGNSSGVNDAGAALVIAHRNVVLGGGLEALGTVRHCATAAGEPAQTGAAVLSVIPKLLHRAGVAVRDVALWEINEAFASVPLAACRELNIDEDRVNVSGSGCSLGHPIAASGARMLTTLVHALRRRGGGIGVAAMCAAGGQSGAVLVQV